MDMRALGGVPAPVMDVPAPALVAAIERLAGALSTEDVIATLRSTARRLVGSDGICVVLRDDDKCHYIEEDAIAPLWKGQRFPMVSCISGWAMMNADTAIIPDIFKDDRIPHAIYRQTFVRSLVMTPVGRDEPLAAIGAYWSKIYEPPTEVVDTLRTLARAAATALENVRLIGALSASLRKTELARDEMRHRLKNVLSAIDTFGAVALPKEQAAQLSARIGAMSRAQALLDDRLQSDGAVSLGNLIENELEPYRGMAPGRIEASGAEVRVAGAQAVALGLVINELVTGAAKTGALSWMRGRVNVRWREESRVVMIDWHEMDGPAAQATVENIGSRLVRRLVEGQLNGIIRRSMTDGKVSCFIEFRNEAAGEFPANA